MKKYDKHLFESEHKEEDFADNHDKAAGAIMDAFHANGYHVSSHYKETPHRHNEPNQHRTATTEMHIQKRHVRSDGGYDYEHHGNLTIITSNRDAKYHGIAMSNDKTGKHYSLGSEHTENFGHEMHKIFSHTPDAIKESVESIVNEAMRNLLGMTEITESAEGSVPKRHFNSLQKRHKTIQKKREEHGNSDQVAKKGS